MELLAHNIEGLLDLHLDVLGGLNQGVVDEGVQERDDVHLVLAEDSQDDFTGALEDTLFLEDTKCVHDVLSQAEGHDLGNLQLRTLFKDTVEIDMSYFSSVLMDQDVVTMAISQASHIADNRPNGSRFDEVETGLVPQFWAWEVVGKPAAQDRFDVLLDLAPYGRMGVSLVKVLCLLLNVLHFSLDVVLAPVLSDHTLKGARVLDPLDQSRVATKGNNRISSQSKVSLAGIRVVVQHFVAQHGEVDEPLLLTKISVLVTLQQEIVDPLVRSEYSNLLGLFF